ncbi:MAG TPA: amidohydrolase family protein [Acidimicrobiales bacterium]|jgi:predicted TIM-barrel fold metal-dependent hydrolase|nr:amidohydrolase family protein [Acidimicrobiales bacterium]
MPLQPHMKLISVDDHLIEPPGVWQDRLPAADREAGPRIVETEEGQQVWSYQGKLYPTLGLNAVAGKPREEFGNDPTRYDEMPLGAYDPAARLKDMDLAGVHAEMCFPTFPRFAGTMFLEGEDRGLALRCVQAYNDFLIDEWCATAPDRYIPMTILPMWDPELSRIEFERTVAKGARAVTFPENPEPLGLPTFHTDHWDPIMAVANETETPICLHFGTSSIRPPHATDAPFAVSVALMGCNSMFTVVDLIFSQLFHKFPNLKVAMSEGSIGWMPYMIRRMEDTWERHRFYTHVNLDVHPVDLFAQHIYGCFIEDEAGLKLRHDIGIKNIMWESDYPHSDSRWPDDRKLLEEAMADIPDDEVHRIVELNARELFHFGADAG